MAENFNNNRIYRCWTFGHNVPIGLINIIINNKSRWSRKSRQTIPRGGGDRRDTQKKKRINVRTASSGIEHSASYCQRKSRNRDARGFGSSQEICNKANRCGVRRFHGDTNNIKYTYMCVRKSSLRNFWWYYEFTHVLGRPRYVLYPRFRGFFDRAQLETGRKHNFGTIPYRI